ncbi:MAG: FAD-dependent oxidoreductase [Coriobacteriia bacterium]|jgi:hypothetical protein|nr:FAD-dependent oxidoreductase [Coriobacteriia bacterium]MDR2714151.1 FAD-dependent oxidoreductase [Coriobacteriales bacterium]
MPLPQLSDEARKEALKKAAEARTARAALREKVKTGQLSIAQVLDNADDPVVAKIKVSTLLESLPGFGKAKVQKLMEDLGISETRRVKGLGDKQKAALLEYLD